MQRRKQSFKDCVKREKQAKETDQKKKKKKKKKEIAGKREELEGNTYGNQKEKTGGQFYSLLSQQVC